MCCRTFLLNRERAVDYLNMLDRLYVFDGYAGWDPEVSCVGNSCYIQPGFCIPPAVAHVSVLQLSLSNHATLCCPQCAVSLPVVCV